MIGIMTFFVTVIARDLGDIFLVGAVLSFHLLNILGLGCCQAVVGSFVILTRGKASLSLILPSLTYSFLLSPRFLGGL